MSERKSINKWYPPDYDPSKVPRRKLPKGVAPPTQKVRLMAPYSMRCTNCNEYIAARRKFNARKEVTGEKYMNFKIIRFYITCPRCNGSITFKTSPQTAGYLPENGAVRNFEKSEPSATKSKGEVETEEDILERLEAELKREEQYRLAESKRKFDPFWKPLELVGSQGGDVMENLQRKLDQEQRQQAMYDELEEIQNKKSKLNQIELTIDHNGSESQATDKEDDEDNSDLDEQLALEAFRNSKRDQDQDQKESEEDQDEHEVEEKSTPNSFETTNESIVYDEPPQPRILSNSVVPTRPIGGTKTFKITKKGHMGVQKVAALTQNPQSLVNGYSLSSEDYSGDDL
ncbi:uncharacterized protein KQ657_003249 [Scheffersomyces spartinae]|uniref:Splicing factor YJU2 n=1 Tax=Scheffersomyces spartinae TaxID=45513 RepID=A0A9P7VCK5_9ASCO|nr:uncharacterized protein KQ657_003249 [Scheffersomyces spartinae]KAG7195486.1 hypothetical protein KQ657_003249 [Scheffersomyces spartinae]